MKVAKSAIGRHLDQPDPATRLYLFWGPDAGQSRELALRLLRQVGAERFIVVGGEVRSDPATLADEAGAISLFGGKRVIWIEPAGEEIVPGVRALLDAPMIESPVIAIGSASARPRELVKIAETSPLAVSFASYPPEGRDAERMVCDVARRFGLSVEPTLASHIASACNNDQAVVAQEMGKFALYLDADPNRPKVLEPVTVEAIGANLSDGDPFGLADLALSGNMVQLSHALTEVPLDSNAVPIVRSLFARLLVLAPVQARVERGERLSDVLASMGKSLFWRDKKLLEKIGGRWSAADIEHLVERAAQLQEALLFTNAPPAEALGEELVAIARAGQHRR